MGLSNEKSKFRMLSDKGKIVISTLEMLTIPDSDNDLEVIL